MGAQIGPRPFRSLLVTFRTACILALTLLCLSGCRPTGAPAAISSGGPSWSRLSDNLLPGIDVGSAALAGWNGENVFVVWSDTTSSGSNSHTTARGASYAGHFDAREGRRVEYHCDTTDGKTGVLTLDGRDYDLGQGTLFLVSTAGPKTRVLQLKRDVRALRVTPDAIWRLAEGDKEIVEFFTPKGP
jgi:hypothetical protein